MRQLFLNPRNIAGIEQAVISLVSGNVIDNRAVRRHLRLFRLIYLLACLSRPRLALAARRQRRRNVRVVPG